MPNFSTLSWRQKTLKVNIPYCDSDGPLHLQVDNMGIKLEGEENTRKHGDAKRRVWRKTHIGFGEKSEEIRAAEFITSDVVDAPMLPKLPVQIPPDQENASITADGAFDTRKCHDVIAARKAAAIIPPRNNAKPWKPGTAGAIARIEIPRTLKRVDRTILRRWSGYHGRSRAETKMHCVKLLGQRLPAQDCIAVSQIASAFTVSFFCRLTNGFTWAADSNARNGPPCRSHGLRSRHRHRPPSARRTRASG